MKFDLHTHHSRCGHAEGSIRDYIKAAIEKGLAAIGISDHSPYFADERDHPSPKVAMAKSEFANYVREAAALKEEYRGKIEVLVGVESDFFPEHADVYRRAYSPYPFDYIIGSVHQVDGLSIFNKNRWKKLNEEEKIAVKDRYYELIEQSARCGLFDVLGHIDAMKAYYPEFSRIPGTRLDSVLKAIGDMGLAIEVNTSGKTKDVGGWYPSDDILERALHYGVSVTFGSDAHVPDRVGDEFDLVAARLREIGFREWVYFRSRRKIAVPL